MAYPTFGISLNSEETLNSDLVLDRSISSKVRIRSFGDYNYRTFKVVHTTLTDTQKNTLVSYYTTNKALVFALYWAPGLVTYNYCVFSGPPKLIPLGGNFWQVEVIIEQIQDG